MNEQDWGVHQQDGDEEDEDEDEDDGDGDEVCLLQRLPISS